MPVLSLSFSLLESFAAEILASSYQRQKEENLPSQSPQTLSMKLNAFFLGQIKFLGLGFGVIYDSEK